MRLLHMLGMALFLAAAATAGEAGGETAALRRADLAEFRSNFLEQDRSYSAAARADAETRLARLERDAAGLSPAAFELELARIVALADNGHTSLFAGPRSRRFNRIPLRLEPFGERFFVLRAAGPLADLLGAELLGIDGHATAELLAAARSLQGGVPSHRDRSAPYLFESPDQLFALGLSKAPDAAVYRFATPGGVVERRLSADPPDPDRGRANADRWLFPERMSGEGETWRTLLGTDRAPEALRQAGEPFRRRVVSELDALVVELRQNDGDGIQGFLSETTRAIKEARPKNLVLDMRLNGGGDLNNTRDFAESLPALVPGRIFVLTSPWTFSAAISTVGYLKQKAPSRVTLVGEAVGDRLVFFAEGRPVTLSNSGIVLLPSTQRHDYRNGCREFTDCHGAVVRHPIAVPTLDPEIAAPWTIEAYRAGRDPGMEAIAAALRP
ncbi:MAG TPA: hypothetical protein VGS03_15725 [Candidatus Polarisedimenticolia bacterium]|jgi:hypothetical protein|nr:hypothetical protein [Candidatus Polarisedimenticolia bacterium]